MHPYRERAGIVTGILIAIELYLSTRSKWAADAEAMADSGKLAGALITVVGSIVVLAVVTGVVAYAIIFRCVYFGAEFDGPKQIQTEGGWCFKMAMIATACALAVVWLVVIIF